LFFTNFVFVKLNGHMGLHYFWRHLQDLFRRLWGYFQENCSGTHCGHTLLVD